MISGDAAEREGSQDEREKGLIVNSLVNSYAEKRQSLMMR
jgi:hypothetical protein